jgi:RNA polymerase sigma-70 factor (subfamily 1)
MGHSSTSAVTRDVVLEIREGNREAFDQLFARVRDKLLVCCELAMSRRLRTKVEPEDVLQDTYAEAFRLFATFEPGKKGSFYRWLARIAVNRIRNLHRHYFETDKRGSGADLSLDGDPQSRTREGMDGPLLSSQSPTPSRVLMNREAVDEVVALVRRLPEELADVVRLRIYESRTVEETARETGVHKDTVTARLVRALEELARLQRSAEADG